MKKLVFVLAFTFGAITFSKAQQGGGRNMGTPEERAQRSTDQLVTRLKLSDDQKAKVYSINLDQSKKTDSLIKAPGDMQDKRPAMMSIRQASDEKVKALLTDDQKKQFDTWQQERRSRMGGGGGGGR